MFISKVSLVNYKNIANVKFLFNKGINTIIGENGFYLATNCHKLKDNKNSGLEWILITEIEIITTEDYH